MDEVVYTCNRNLQKGINLARSGLNKGVEHLRCCWWLGNPLYSISYFCFKPSLGSVPSNPVCSQTAAVMNNFGLIFADSVVINESLSGQGCQNKHNFPFLWVSERRLRIYFQVFVPTGLKYISPESYTQVYPVGLQTTNTNFWRVVFGSGGHRSGESPSGPKCRHLLFYFFQVI